MLEDLRRRRDQRGCWSTTSTGCTVSRSELEAFFELCKRLGSTNVATVTRRDRSCRTRTGSSMARILGAVAKKESDDKSRRIRRKHEEIARSAAGVSGGGSRPYGYEADKLTRASGGGGDHRECAQRLLAGEPVRSIAADLNERGVTSASGGSWSPQSSAPDARLAADQRPAEHHGEIVATAVWPAIISAEDGATIRALLANPERRTNKAARRYLLGGLLVCSHCGERLVARPRSGGKRRYACAQGRGVLRLRQDLHQRRRGRGSSSPTPCCTGSIRPSCSAPLERPPAAAPDAAALVAGGRGRQAQLRRARRRRTGSGEITMDEWRAARKPIEQRLTAARKQLAQGHAARSALDRYVGNGERCAPIGTRSTSASSTRSSPPCRLRRRRPGRRGYNRFDESRLTPVWRP